MKILRGEFGLSKQYADEAINNLPLKFSRNNYQQLITAGRYLKGIGAEVILLDKSGNTVPIDADHSRYKNVKEDNGKKSKTERILEFIIGVAGVAMIIFFGASIFYAIFD